MAYILGNTENIITGEITDTDFNNCHISPVELFTINKPFIPLFFGLYFYDVSIDFEFNGDIIALKQQINGLLMLNSIDMNVLATNESLFYLYLIKGYTISGTQPFNGLPIELKRSQPLIVDGIGKIKYKFGYTYI